MGTKKPFAWLGVVVIAGTQDSIRPRTFPLFELTPENKNEFGHYVFALPEAHIVAFSTAVTAWIGFLPDDLPFHGRKNPDPLESKSWVVSFDETVIMVSDGKSNQRTRFLKVNGQEVPIHSGDDLDCLVAAFKTEREAHEWTEKKAIHLITSHEEQPS